jgi:hypothetical protein
MPGHLTPARGGGEGFDLLLSDRKGYDVRHREGRRREGGLIMKGRRNISV